MDRSTITGDVIKHYQKHCDGKRAVAFCTSISHAEHVAAEFQAQGYKACCNFRQEQAIRESRGADWP
jgi:superfamily II DNA or RNA helicase